MSVTELRCSNCNAPVDAAQGALQKCRYCGATLVVRGAAPVERAVTRFAVVLVRCGPSNVARVARLLRDHRFEAAEADALARRAPCDVLTSDERAPAEALARELGEAGAVVEVAERTVMVPIPPDVRVRLDDAGANRVAVMRAIREYVDLGMAEAKALVGRAPCVVVEVIDQPRGRALHAALLAAGALAHTEALPRG